MRFYTHTQLSEHIAETPEGFLVCKAVPIARVGVMEYSPGQVPVEAAEDGSMVRIERTEEMVFAPESMASFEGKPTTVDHPAEDVTPDNWKELAKGHAQNIRRGAGEASDLLLADLMITDEKAIALVRGGLREISCGYDADYEQVTPGHGRQSNIRGNHIALVHRGRCGSRCRINDESEDSMAKKNKFLDAFTGWLKTPEAQKVLDEMEEETPVKAEEEQSSTDSDEDRLTALENKLNELQIEVRSLAGSNDEADPEEDKPVADEEQPVEPDVPDEKGKARDAALARTVDADTMARAKTLVPGIHVQDSDKLCAVQRTTLRVASKDTGVASVVNAALRGSTLDSCDCMTLDAAFLAASEVAKMQNNAKTADGLVKVSTKDFGKTVTPADINAMNSEFHKKG
jgi:hypothetical protein